MNFRSFIRKTEGLPPKEVSSKGISLKEGYTYEDLEALVDDLLCHYYDEEFTCEDCEAKIASILSESSRSVFPFSEYTRGNTVTLEMREGLNRVLDEFTYG